MLRLLLSRLAAWPGTDRALLALAALALLAGPLRLAVPLWVTSPQSESGQVSAQARALEPDRLSGLPPARLHLAPEVITATVVAAPFRDDRTAPARRYRPGQPNEEQTARPNVAGLARIPGYRLLAIAASGGVRLAVIDGAAGRNGARVYRVGEALDAYQLIEIAGDSVVVSGEDTTFVLRILRPWVPRDR